MVHQKNYKRKKIKEENERCVFSNQYHISLHTILITLPHRNYRTWMQRLPVDRFRQTVSYHDLVSSMNPRLHLCHYQKKRKKKKAHCATIDKPMFVALSSKVSKSSAHTTITGTIINNNSNSYPGRNLTNSLQVLQSLQNVEMLKTNDAHMTMVALGGRGRGTRGEKKKVKENSIKAQKRTWNFSGNNIPKERRNEKKKKKQKTPQIEKSTVKSKKKKLKTKKEYN